MRLESIARSLIIKPNAKISVIEIILKTAFIIAIIINKKIAKTKAGLLNILIIKILLKNGFFNYSFNKLFKFGFSFTNYNFFYYYSKY